MLKQLLVEVTAMYVYYFGKLITDTNVIQVHISILKYILSIHSNTNVNTGHGTNHSTDESFAVQTPAVNFSVVTQMVSFI